MINILIVDDHEMIRKGISSLLQEDAEINVLGSVENGEKAVEFCLEKKVDVVLMDLQMPIMGGVEATSIIVKKRPKTKVLAVTINEETSFILDVLQAGATGYIMKHSSREEIVEAIQDVANGKKHFSGEILQKITTVFSQGKTNNLRNPATVILTNKESQVLQHLVMEKTNSEIAELLDCSVRTVDTHKRNIIKKLG